MKHYPVSMHSPLLSALHLYVCHKSGSSQSSVGEVGLKWCMLRAILTAHSRAS